MELWKGEEWESYNVYNIASGAEGKEMLPPGFLERPKIMR